MSDFTSGFWDVYIAILTAVSIAACAVLLWSQTKGKAPAAADTTGHVWDEDLSEYNNPLPAWWRWLFYLTIVFGAVYLVLYPGLGSSWKGVLGWSQVSQLREETQKAEQQYGPLYEKFAALEVKDLARNPAALAVGQKLFLNHCAQCHASDAGGSRGFPNLTDKDWLWGGEPAQIEATITGGRNGVMPPWGPVLGEDGVKNVAHYVMSLSGGSADSIRVSKGKDIFASTCAACHGAEGKGNVALGAPNLTDKIWLHGSGEAAISETITKGRTSQMPAHKDLLTAAKIHILTAYVWSLSNTPGQ
ncbi:MAG TPA: cytochrome-c oxidase, cbb3-type subunit III [Burkholderiales bacterium]|nr:cytochrome-c oxidase, cbb3-type subunit III [Burkholderiales bacterium]